MDKKLIVSAVLLAMLAACSSNAVKDKPSAPSAGASKSTGQANAGSNNKGTTANSGSSTNGRSGSSGSTAPASSNGVSYNPLKDPSNILSKRSVLFDFDKDDVKAEYRDLVAAHAKYVAEHPDAKVTLQGNADNRGSREYNVSLGQRRAVSVKKVMNVNGASDNQIETVSFGEEKAHDCKDEACFQQDRRVDIVYDNE
jgi:peptidoglycan-associated lipoprotein